MFFGGEPWLLQCANENVTVHQAFATAAQKLTATTDIRVRTRSAHIRVRPARPACARILLLLLLRAQRATAGSKIERRGRAHPRGAAGSDVRNMC